jgi:carbonic anhydrase/acetyltransferase-like protein (isoleucine patch superfamily)
MSSTQKDDGLISIGDNVIIGVNCEIDSCIIESYTLIGNAAIIQKDCIIQSYSVVAAGSNLQPGTFVPTGQVIHIFHKFE